jgi:hypothetical protein
LEPRSGAEAMSESVCLQHGSEVRLLIKRMYGVLLTAALVGMVFAAQAGPLRLRSVIGH